MMMLMMREALQKVIECEEDLDELCKEFSGRLKRDRREPSEKKQIRF